LKSYVRAVFHFASPAADARRDTPPICPALFADAGASIVFDVGRGWTVEGLWTPRVSAPSGHVIGPMTRGWPTAFGAGVDAVGAYLRPGASEALLGVPASLLTDDIVAVHDLWPRDGAALADAIERASGRESRFVLLERALLRKLRSATAVPDRTVIALARAGLSEEHQPTVERLAERAGLSRQQLTRRFRSALGLPPKVFLRLSRFRRVLQAGMVRANDWASLAADVGYADQSHLIAEFRQFTGLTPEALRTSHAFHPFAHVP
jgi:AraC-like DNA-binding protein